MQGVPLYNTGYVMEIIEHIVEETSIDIHLTLVWIPGLNNEDIPEIIELELRIGIRKSFPPFGIQKYETHRCGRRLLGLRALAGENFRDFLKKFEQEYDISYVLLRI